MKICPTKRFGTGNVHSLAFLKQGKSVAAGILDSIHFFRSDSGEETGRLACAHADLITGLAILEDELLCSGSLDGTLRLWRLGKGEVESVAEIHMGGRVHAVCVAADDRFVCASDRGLGIVTRTGGRTVVSTEESLHSVCSVPGTRQVVSGAEDGTLSMWDLGGEPARRKILLNHYGDIVSLQASPDGQVLSFLSEEERVHFYHIENSRHSSIALGKHQASSQAWDPSGEILFLGTSQGSGVVLDVGKQTILGSVGGYRHPVRAMVSPSRNRAFMGGWDGHIVQIHRSRSGWEATPFKTQALSYVLSVHISPEGWNAVSGHSDGHVRVWPLIRGQKPILDVEASKEALYTVRYSPDGARFATGSVDTSIKVWDSKEKILALDLKDAHEDPVYGLDFSPDSRLLASGSGDTYATVYDIDEVKKKAAQGFGDEEYWHYAVRRKVLNAVRWAPDQKRFVVGVSDGSAVVLFFDGERVEKGPVLKAHRDPVSCVDWSRDGGLIAAGSYDRSFSLWDGLTYRKIGDPVQAHEEPIQCLAFSPCGSWLATGSWDGCLKIWDVEERRELACVTRPHFNAVEGVCWAPKGDRLVSGSSDGTLILWTVERESRLRGKRERDVL